MQLAGRVALVTGGNRGIGAHIATALGAAGAAVGVHYHSDAAGAARVVDAIVAAGGRACAVQADIRDRAAAVAMAETIAAALGPPDILVNNARQLGEKKKFLELAWSDYALQLDVIVMGAFHCCQAVLPSMIARGRGGRIVNMLSTVIEEPSWRWHAYGAAKGALHQFTRNLAAEMGPQQITVNMVSPGFTRTAERQTPHGDAYLEDYLAQTPLGRFPRPDEVAQAVLYLCSDAAACMTGVNLPVCGGKVMI